jgi:hypothetical protein
VKKKAIILPILIIFLFFKPCYSEEEKVISLTLEECVIKALKDNLSVAVEVINPELAEASVSKAKETFMPRFDFAFGNEWLENPSYWWLEQADTVINRNLDFSVSFVQEVPTGGNFSLTLYNVRSETTAGGQSEGNPCGSEQPGYFHQPV